MQYREKDDNFCAFFGLDCNFLFSKCGFNDLAIPIYVKPMSCSVFKTYGFDNLRPSISDRRYLTPR